MNNQISNPKTEVKEGLSLNDKDYLDNILSSLKNLEKNYTIALTEVSNENLYSQLYNIFEITSELQRETYELMFKKGWYVLEQSDSNKVLQKYQTLSQEFQNLNI